MDQKPNLPEQIINLPTRGPKGTIHTSDYLAGHRDARHAAAELAAAALSAPPAQEPVAYIVRAANGNVRLWSVEQAVAHGFAADVGATVEALYASPLPQEPQEGKAPCAMCGGSGEIRRLELTPGGRRIQCVDVCPACGDARDAARYRWLRAQSWFDGPLCVVRDPKKALTTGASLGADCPSLSRLDEAVDAAMSATLASREGEQR